MATSTKKFADQGFADVDIWISRHVFGPLGAARVSTGRPKTPVNCIGKNIASLVFF